MRSLALILALAVAPAASADVRDFTIDLDVAQATTALAGAAGSGTGTATLDTDTNLFSWNFSWGGTTGTETVAHFHIGAPGVPGGVELGLPTGSPKVGSATISDIQEANVLASLWYANIHTSHSSDGEIRGQVLLVAVCGNSSVESGEQCDDGNNDNCDGCSSTCQTEVSCQAADPPCEGGELCNPGTGLCDLQPDAAFSTSCDLDGNSCTSDHCDGNGTCVLDFNVICQAATQCEGGEVCNPSSGLCDPQPDPSAGAPCDTDSDLCTIDECNGAGTCANVGNVTCTTLDDCHDIGMCEPGTGVCSNPQKPNGSSCDDADVCTNPDECQSGSCVGNLESCGNGTVETSCGEECDDGNNDDGDGCSVDCLVEGGGIPVLPESGLILFALLLLGTSVLMLRHRLRSRI